LEVSVGDGGIIVVELAEKPEKKARKNEQQSAGWLSG